MIDKIFKTLKKNNIQFVSGVPDSVLKVFSIKLNSYFYKKNLITSNEGNAVAVACGVYLKTGKMPLVYLQNSGLGNIINPITSLAHKSVYSIPLLFFIGWRGDPSAKDEVQHKFQGKITPQILKILQIKYIIFDPLNLKKLDSLISYGKKNKKPVAVLFRKNTFKNIQIKNKKKPISYTDIKRAEFIKYILDNTKKQKIVATTGYTSRELYKLSQNKKNNNFYMVGAMGHSAMLSYGYSLFSKKNIICLDGDGSFLMHLGGFAAFSKFKNKNFKYVLLNNNSHESVGGQKTDIENIDIKNLIHSFGFKHYLLIRRKNEMAKKVKEFLIKKSSSFLEVKILNKSIINLPRIRDLNLVKKNFMK